MAMLSRHVPGKVGSNIFSRGEQLVNRKMAETHKDALRVTMMTYMMAFCHLSCANRNKVTAKDVLQRSNPMVPKKYETARNRCASTTLG